MWITVPATGPERSLGDPGPQPQDSPATGALPDAVSVLVGRTQESASVTTLLLREDVRLVTLTGPGGVGKTRLAMDVAGTIERCFAHSVCFVSLAPARSPGLVISVIGQALGLADPAVSSVIERLRYRLAEQPVLLVLDNFEHVDAAAPLVAELLTACPRLRTLVTSRSRLRVGGEHEYPVPPLRLPDRSANPAASDLERTEAVALFVHRARAVLPDFALDRTNADTVAEICRQLDGLPLAIELAAARSKVLSPPALLARLTNRLELLTGGMRDVPARLRTMRDAIAWSYDLLDADERALFRRMAVFAGGWPLAAAEHLASPGTADKAVPGKPPVAVLDAVSSLVDKSFLRRNDGPDGDPRFGMLETIREYGLEQLAHCGEEMDARAAHAAWCLALAERSSSNGADLERDRRHRDQAAEMANMRGALVWLSATGQGEQALRLAVALTPVWEVHGHWAEGRQWLEALLARSAGEAQTASLRGRAFAGLGALTSRLRDFGRAADCYEQSLALARATGDVRGIASALDCLGYLANDEGDRPRAESLLAESLALYRDLGDECGTAKVLDTLGLVAMLHGDRARAGALLEDSLAHSRSAGERWQVAITLTNLGVLANHERDYARARVHLEESLALSRAIGNNWLIPLCLSYLGLVEQVQGDTDRAAALFAESLTLCRDRGAQLPAPRNLEGLAAVAVTRGHSERAARLFGAALAMRTAIRGPMLPPDRAIYEPIVAHLRQTLGESAFAAAWAAGRTAPTGSAIDEALAVAAAPAAVPTGSGTIAAAALPSLTPRERAVLRLLAAGRSDREIAVALFISHRTVHHHVANVYAKLGVHTRAAAARVAVGAGLLDDGAGHAE